jgi:hypothetical protein
VSQQPAIERNGDTWALSWTQHGIEMGMERLTDTRDGLRAEVTVESLMGGRVLGPVWLNIISTESQVRFANACTKRVNGLGSEVWHALVVNACAVVAKQYRAPTPTIDLSSVDTSPDVEYLIPGLVPVDETTVLYGDGESSKSLTALRIAASVVLGQILPWGARPTRTCPTLYLDWETNPRTVSARLRRVALGMVTSTPSVFYRQCFRSLNDELPSIREEVAKKGIGLVVVDSIGFAVTGALTEDDTARGAMNALRQLSPATRLVVAHVSASTAQQTTGAARPFGSTFFWNGMRSGLELRRSEDGPDPDSIELGLFHRKANDGEHHKPIGLSVLFDGRKGAIAFFETDVNETPDLAARTTLSSRLRSMLRKSREPLTTDDLADHMETPIDTVSKALRRMTDVVQVNQGGGRGHPATWGLASER